MNSRGGIVYWKTLIGQISIISSEICAHLNTCTSSGLSWQLSNKIIKQSASYRAPSSWRKYRTICDSIWQMEKRTKDPVKPQSLNVHPLSRITGSYKKDFRSTKQHLNSLVSQNNKHVKCLKYLTEDVYWERKSTITVFSRDDQLLVKSYQKVLTVSGHQRQQAGWHFLQLFLWGCQTFYPRRWSPIVYLMNFSRRVLYEWPDTYLYKQWWPQWSVVLQKLIIFTAPTRCRPERLLWPRCPLLTGAASINLSAPGSQPTVVTWPSQRKQ